jgi:hypothetical protein
VRSDALEIIALGDKVGLEGSAVDQGIDILCNDMNAGSDATQRRRGCTSLGSDSRNSASEGLDWTEPGRARGVVDGRTALSILLVVEIKGDRFGKLEFGEGVVLGTTSPFRRKVTSCTRNCSVRVRTLRRGIVYSPTRSKKKKAMMIRSAVARVSACCGA